MAELRRRSLCPVLLLVLVVPAIVGCRSTPLKNCQFLCTADCSAADISANCEGSQAHDPACTNPVIRSCRQTCEDAVHTAQCQDGDWLNDCDWAALPGC